MNRRISLLLFPLFFTSAALAEITDPDWKPIAEIMSMSEEQVIALVPEQTPIECADPAAGAYLRGLKKNWKWSAANPDKIISPIDGLAYPNAKFPMDRKAVYLNYNGQKIERAYWEGPKAKGDLRGNPNPERYFFEGAVDKKKFDWLKGQLIKLTEVYRDTGNEQVARRIIVILARFAEVYPHYLLSEGRGINNYYISTGGPWMFNGKKKEGSRHPYSWTAGRLWGPWLGEIKAPFLDAWGAVRETSVVDKLSKERGHDVRELIDRDLVREMIEFVMDMPWEAQMGNNLAGYFSLMARAGKIIGEPEYVHTAYRYMKDLIPTYGKTEDGGSGFTFDLHHGEGNQGHFGVMVRGYSILQSLEGYSDPEGYVGKRDGLHLDNFSAEKDLPLFARMVDAPFAYQLPNGSLTPLNDTMGWMGEGRIGVEMIASPLEASYPRLLPGLGHAVLGAGQGTQQVQVHLEFSEQGANHPHMDCLGITWFANGREASGDIGYQRNKLRAWSAHALSHNTVVVDQSDQQRHRDAFGNVQFYVDSLPGLAAIQVDAPDAYADGRLTRYRRTLVHVTTDPKHPYFIDVFEVHGGNQHDYAIHGNLEGRDAGACSIELEKIGEERPLLPKGENWKEPNGMGSFNVYGLFQNVATAKIQPSAFVDFKDKQDGAGTRIHLPMSDGQLFLGETPGLRNAGHYNDDAVYDDWMPHFIVRRKGKSGLKSTFVAVYDIHSGTPGISSVKQIDTGPDTVVLAIQAGGRTDAFVLQLEERRNIEIGPLKTDARLALAQDLNGKPLLRMIEGTTLVASGEQISAPLAMVSRPVTSMGEQSFEVDLGASQSESLARWAVLLHDAAEGSTHAYPISSRSDTEVLLRLSHGLKMTAGQTEEVFSPWRIFDTGGELRIPSAVSNQKYRPDEYPFPEPMARYAHDVTAAQEPVRQSSGSLQPGLRWTMTATHDKGGKTHTEGVDPAPLAPENQLNHSLVKQWDGYFQAEADGVYTFSVTADHGAVLKIGDEPLIDSRYLRRFRPFESSIRLKAGLHRLQIEHHFRKARYAPWLEIKVNGSELSKNKLWHE
ncbi:MAG: hypothetical protein COA78_27800 [Blastopirellula sp.]|nr:MAG: hypothetical protein COA78_27800 [Blastopirellula sp.]